jgi:pimeloyl-ACP methyl ester carboxylesterase
VAGAAQSFAPAGTPVVGRGLGALVGIAANAKAPGQLGRLVLVDTLPGSLAALKSPWPVNSPDFADQLEARDWLAARIGEGGDVGEEAERSARLETIEGADGRWSWRHHLATLPEGTPTVLDDESLWAQLAAAEAPLLIRTEGGPLDDKAVARFTADVPGGETATTEPGPAALAAVLNTLLA